MDAALKEIFWKQFGGAIEMLENALTACPEELWNTDSKFWYNTYHTLFYLDYYLTQDPEKFSPPSPFTLSEFDNAGAMPERTYTKEELLGYLSYCRNKCHAFISGLTNDSSAKRWVNEYRNYSVPEILIYNIRHVQHHVGQLNLLLRQGIDNVPKWVSQTKVDL